MPLRRSRVDALDVIAYTDGIVTLDLRVSSGTYVRAIAEALGGHCVTLRRLEVGPFSVEDADEEHVIPAERGAGAAARERPCDELEPRQRCGRDRDVRRRPPAGTAGCRDRARHAACPSGC